MGCTHSKSDTTRPSNQAIHRGDMPCANGFLTGLKMWRIQETTRFLRVCCSVMSALSEVMEGVNRHNVYHYSGENPHSFQPNHVQGRFNVTAWAGVVGDQVIGPYFWPDNVTAEEWIGKYSPTVEWGPCSPDLTPLDFFLWGYIKDRVYGTVPEDRDTLMARITVACDEVTPQMLHNVRNNLARRLTLCVENMGGHFEHGGQNDPHIPE